MGELVVNNIAVVYALNQERQQTFTQSLRGYRFSCEGINTEQFTTTEYGMLSGC